MSNYSVNTNNNNDNNNNNEQFVPILTEFQIVLGAHTNTIEGCWRHAKKFILPKQPRTAQELQLLLYVYMWRKWRCQDWPGGAFSRLLSDIALYYR